MYLTKKAANFRAAFFILNYFYFEYRIINLNNLIVEIINFYRDFFRIGSPEELYFISSTMVAASPVFETLTRFPRLIIIVFIDYLISDASKTFLSSLPSLLYE